MTLAAIGAVGGGGGGAECWEEFFGTGWRGGGEGGLKVWLNTLLGRHLTCYGPTIRILGEGGGGAGDFWEINIFVGKMCEINKWPQFNGWWKLNISSTKGCNKYHINI